MATSECAPAPRLRSFSAFVGGFFCRDPRLLLSSRDPRLLGVGWKLKARQRVWSHEASVRALVGAEALVWGCAFVAPWRPLKSAQVISLEGVPIRNGAGLRSGSHLSFCMSNVL